jgi:hypothetical protein
LLPLELLPLELLPSELLPSELLPLNLGILGPPESSKSFLIGYSIVHFNVTCLRSTFCVVNSLRFILDIVPQMTYATSYVLAIMFLLMCDIHY